MHLQTTYWFVFIILTVYKYHHFVQVSHVASPSKRNRANRVSYEGAQVWRTRLRNTRQVVLLRRLADEQEISIWKLKATHADFLVRPERKVDVDRRLKSQHLNHSVLLINVQRQLDAVATPPAGWDAAMLRAGHRLNFNYYPELDVIDEYMSYAGDQYKSICTVKSIGRSVENRTIQMAVVSNKNPSNKAILLNAGIHAREWITVTSWLWFLNELLTKFDSQPEYVKNVDWYIIPVLNPDGYEYSHKVDRLWRKNRRSATGATGRSCSGVDLNRNFGTSWYVNGVTIVEACSDTNSGMYEFSEPESIALRNVINSRKMSAFVDLHSFGQTVAYPWSWVNDPPKNEPALRSAAEDMSMAILNKYGKKFKIGSVYDAVYPASGSALDYGYASGIPLSFAIEARDTGHYGFLLPPDQIKPAAVELQAATYTLANALEPFLLRSEDCHRWF